MKNFFSILTMLFFTGVICAQTVNKINNNKITTLRNTDNPRLSGKNPLNIGKADHKIKNNKGDISDWFSYAETIQNTIFPGGGNNLYGNFLTPDSLLKIQYTNGWWGWYCHSVAFMLDPSSDVYVNKIDITHPYSVDSILLPYIYTRKINNNKADTLIVQLMTGYAYPIYFWEKKANPWVHNYFGVDTISFGGIYADPITLNFDTKTFDLEYDNAQIPIKHVKVYTYKRIINENDTAYNYGTNYSAMQFATPDAHVSPDDNLIVVSAHFKPGYSYTEGEHYTDKNYFEFLAYEENGTGTYPTYTPNDYNCTSILNDESIYDPSNGWYGMYIPEWDFQKNYTIENFWVNVKLSQTSVGIKENIEKSVILSQNNPNPAENSTIINYKLKDAGFVNLTVTDMTGREVMIVNEGRQISGSHSITLNTSTFSNGLYYYTINAGGTKLTKKMIISK